MTTLLLAAGTLTTSALAQTPENQPFVRQPVAKMDRPASAGVSHYVDPVKGSDDHAGTKEAPWKTIQASLVKLKPGDTLVLRGGTYFENIYCAINGTPEAPITIRSHPGELAIVDGGIPEFERDPAAAWEPAEGGAPGEFQSVQTFRNIRDVVGLFSATNIGLQTYWHLEDLRAKNELWIRDPDRKNFVFPVYCGPGIWYDKTTGRIHVRLAQTSLPAPVENYLGETDPRKVPLVIAPYASTPLKIDQASHIRFQDLVFRGGGLNNVHLVFGIDIEFDHVTIYGGTYCLRAKNSGPVRITNSALYGGIPPWAFYDENELRSSGMAYSDPFTHNKEEPDHNRNVARLTNHALLVMEGFEESDVFAFPFNNHWEISNSEFADGHDGVYLNGVHLRMHDCWIGNMEDDAFYISNPTPYVGDDIHIYNNYITGCTTTFGAHGRGGPRGSNYIYGNVIDKRGGVHFKRPTPENPSGTIQTGLVYLMHGSSNFWGMESIYFYYNTVILPDSQYAYLGNLASGTLPKLARHIVNNIFVYLGDYPRNPSIRPGSEDFYVDGNVHWSKGQTVPANWLEKVTESTPPALKEKYPEGWESHSVVGDPDFLAFDPAADAVNDYRLGEKTVAKIARSVPPEVHLEGDVRGKAAGAFQPGAKPRGVGVEQRLPIGKLPR